MTPILATLLACTDAGKEPDHSDSADIEAIGCEIAMGGSGAAVGTVDCADGRCVVAAGPFWQGAADPVHPDRCPARAVTLSEYSMDQTEVTRAAWAECQADGVCGDAHSHTQIDTEGEVVELLPMTGINWEEAAAYCEWKGGHLPTEAQWEKAARGTEGSTWSWGSLSPDCTRANFRFSTSYCELGPIDVGHYPDFPSPFGLLDVSGNVWEWTADWFDADWYAEAPMTDPGSPEACSMVVGQAQGACESRVIRGGAFDTTEGTTQVSRRSFADPAVADRNLGLRCAYDP